ncbi:cupin domain-containing protein [Sinomonas terricola]|uniref:cupin domain-containing protein n=1 Tax=Sinomonas terricola TaxID=3110330 RepID=UPI003D17CCA4
MLKVALSTIDNPRGVKPMQREDTEVCYIVSGRATVTDGATGTRYEISGGDVIVQPETGPAAGRSPRPSARSTATASTDRSHWPA